LPENRVTVAIPTLAADAKLTGCVRSLAEQTWRDFEVVVIDNSGKRLARQRLEKLRQDFAWLHVIENESNKGFGAAVNQAWSGSKSPFLATLNDDAAADPRWLEQLLAAMESAPGVGMCASQVRLLESDELDSAGMLICADGSSKQRGHRASPGEYNRMEEALAPSGSAALYRRAMLDEVGGFDEDFFLYCEDTDLGLRARWAGWTCVYAPQAIAHHHYSHTAGRATPLKAYYVERNRLFLLVKNFPVRNLMAAPFVTLIRYGWHAISMLQGRGVAARFREEGNGGGLRLIGLVIRAHWSLLRNWNCVWRKRRAIARTARISRGAFGELLRAHAIGPRQVAEL
jgi:GT2 family glycosyltransferase